MNVVIAVTKQCQHCPIIKRELRQLEIPYSVHYLDAHPEWIEKFGLRGSPNIIVDGELVFRKMPEISALRNYFRDKKRL